MGRRSRSRNRSKSRHKSRREEKKEEEIPDRSWRDRPRSPPSLDSKTLVSQRAQIIENKLGYSKDNNPFGDSNIAEPFIWKKKNDFMKAAGQEGAIPQNPELLVQTQQKLAEIEHVKKRREERIQEEEQMEEQRQLLAREREQEHFDEWVRKEEEFYLDQAQVRSQIRLERGREQPIDLFTKELRVLDGEDFDAWNISKGPAYEVLEEMTEEELAESEKTIKIFTVSDKRHKDFWKNMLVLCQHYLEEKKAQAKASKGVRQRDAETGITTEVLEQIYTLLGKKNYSQLKTLESQVTEKLLKGGPNVDSVYWCFIQSQIPVYKARAYTTQIHETVERMVDDRIQRKKNSEFQQQADDLRKETAREEEKKEEVKPPPEPLKPLVEEVVEETVETKMETETEGDTDMRPPSPQLKAGEWAVGPFSPPLWPVNKPPSGRIVIPVDDFKERKQFRQELLEVIMEKKKKLKEAEAAVEAKSKKRAAVENRVTMDEKTFIEEVVRASKFEEDDEVNFTGSELALAQQRFDWEDKYEPRKPRFFNRIKTGYEWNKYNQSHYDHDNPPPKSVQGYKFNIFYPDLIDNSVAPTYHLESSDSAETVTIRFHAGPPYEDIAFKIINREWLTVPKFGFRCVFERGILQLYFNFKRYRYRR
eukprot:Platyproteum_vivax@DN6782_c0_g1_i2.p1